MLLKKTSKQKFQSFNLRKKKKSGVKPSKSHSKADGASEGWDETASVVKRKNVLSAGDSVDRSQAGDNSQSR